MAFKIHKDEYESNLNTLLEKIGESIPQVNAYGMKDTCMTLKFIPILECKTRKDQKERDAEIRHFKTLFHHTSERKKFRVEKKGS